MARWGELPIEERRADWSETERQTQVLMEALAGVLTLTEDELVQDFIDHNEHGRTGRLTALAELDPALPRYSAVAAYLHERNGDPVTAARLYAEAARSAPNLAERDHLTRQAARLNAQLRN